MLFFLDAIICLHIFLGMDQSCSSEPIRGEGQGGGLAGTLHKINFTHAKYYNGIADLVKNWPADSTILDDRPATSKSRTGLRKEK